MAAAPAGLPPSDGQIVSDSTREKIGENRGRSVVGNAGYENLTKELIGRFRRQAFYEVAEFTEAIVPGCGLRFPFRQRSRQ